MMLDKIKILIWEPYFENYDFKLFDMYQKYDGDRVKIKII